MEALPGDDAARMARRPIVTIVAVSGQVARRASTAFERPARIHRATEDHHVALCAPRHIVRSISSVEESIRWRQAVKADGYAGPEDVAAFWIVPAVRGRSCGGGDAHHAQGWRAAVPARLELSAGLMAMARSGAAAAAIAKGHRRAVNVLIRSADAHAVRM